MVEPCRAESASVADSANNIDVGVSLRKACVGKRLGAVSFRATSCEPGVEIVRRAEWRVFRHSANNVDVGVSPRKACVGNCLVAVSFRPTNTLIVNCS